MIVYEEKKIVEGRREKIIFFIILLDGLYYFIGLYVKLKIGMQGKLLNELVKQINQYLRIQNSFFFFFFCIPGYQYSLHRGCIYATLLQLVGIIFCIQQTQLWHAFNGLNCKITTWGVLHPPTCIQPHYCSYLTFLIIFFLLTFPSLLLSLATSLSCLIFILFSSTVKQCLYYFIKLYIKIRTEMLIIL